MLMVRIPNPAAMDPSAVPQATAGDAQQPSPLQTRKAGDPFDRDDADLIIPSSDQVDFHVHRLVLSLASPVFAAMFAIPQPPGTDPHRPLEDVTEDSDTLDVFLRICYPFADPTLESLDRIRVVLPAATNYEAEAVIASMKRMLSQSDLLTSDPLRVFAIACLFQLEDQARAAAEKAAMDNRIAEKTCPELDMISAGAYYRLRRVDRTRKTCPSRRSPRKPSISRIDFTGIGAFCNPPPSPVKVPRKLIAAATAPFDTCEADFILRSSDSIDFRVYRSIIALASSTILQQATPVDSLGLQLSQPVVYFVPEDSVVLDALLRACYPGACGGYLKTIPFDLLLDVLSAAPISPQPPSHLLRLDFVADCFQWTMEAQAWATALLRSGGVSAIYNTYDPNMETVANGPYRRLLSYVEQCSRAAARGCEISINTGELKTRCCSFSSAIPAPASKQDQKSCADSYSVSFSTRNPPWWLPSIFAEITAALMDMPQGSLLKSGDLAKAFVSAVATKSPPLPEILLEMRRKSRGHSQS
ncbi:hypothetical protein BN946_scf185008.g77 [Trametes cinnabarina]|uniref:BTB domain-containing protein n=1 Tax=Pycnoporus cinnabarinus TaxID=5643 RepID=A0A060SG42_PYCCI|nr:hypothetical protein BN946_scf185008.g77 [Trametes cinnabarina]